jgi:membrane protease YdiL (CAAX protease family)
MVERLLLWLSVEWTGRRLYWAVLWAPIVSLIYVFCVTVVYALTGQLESMESTTGYDSEIFTWTFPLLVVGGVILEEIIFRFPLSLFATRWGATRNILGLALLLSLVFGWVHGSWHHVLLQGVVGFWWCLIYLKSGGLHDRYWKALLVTITAHTIYNTLIIGFVAALGETRI